MAQEIRLTISPELKSDGTIVTQADREVETMLRERLPQLIPGTTVSGEEYGYSAPGPEGVWVVDPVDGTSNFAFGSPLWAVSIGLIRDGAPEMAGIYLPDLDELYMGRRGEGAFRNGKPLAKLVPGPVRPEQLVSYNEHVIPHVNMSSIPGKMRCVGAAVIDGVWVASGTYRGLIGFRERLHDVAAILVLLNEVGAEVRYLDGPPMDLNEIADGRPIGRPWIAFPPNSDFGLAQK